MMAQSDLDTQNLGNRLSLEETEVVLKDILTWDREYRESTLKQKPISEEIAFDPERFALQPLCGAGINDCCITENGDVYPCAGWQAMICGNVYKQSLKEIWEYSPQFNQVRAVTQGDFPECLKCEARNYCAMCLVRNYNESGGDMFKINKHFCDVAFLNKKIVEEFTLMEHLIDELLLGLYNNRPLNDVDYEYVSLTALAQNMKRFQWQQVADAAHERGLIEYVDNEANTSLAKITERGINHLKLSGLI